MTLHGVAVVVGGSMLLLTLGVLSPAWGQNALLDEPTGLVDPVDGSGEATSVMETVLLSADECLGDQTESLEAYAHQVYKEIKSHWQRTAIAPTATTIIPKAVFRVTRMGELEDIQVAVSSGNPAFDDKMLKAVEALDPLPPLPEDVAQEQVRFGVLFDMAFTQPQAMTDYAHQVEAQIRKHWMPSPTASRTPVLVRVGIEKSGRLREIHFAETPDTQHYRQQELSLVTAIDHAQPFPPLPTDFEKDSMEIELLFAPVTPTSLP